MLTTPTMLPAVGNERLPSDLKVHVGDPLAVMVTLPLAVAMSMLLVPFANGKLVEIPVSCEPLPIKKLPLILPVPLTIPEPNNKLPPVTLPVVNTGLEPKAARLATTLALP